MYLRAPEGRQILAHGVSRGIEVRFCDEPQRGERKMTSLLHGRPSFAPSGACLDWTFSIPRAHALG